MIVARREPGRPLAAHEASWQSTVAVPRVAPPRGNNQPILLETISNAPRVFHIHNFLSNAEAESLVAYSEANRDPVYGLHRSTTGVEHQVKLITFVRRK